MTTAATPPGAGEAPPEDSRGVLIPGAIVGLLLGAFITWAAVATFQEIAEAERTASSIKLNVVFLLLYKIGGKWAASALPFLVGVAFLGLGIAAVYELLTTKAPAKR